MVVPSSLRFRPGTAEDDAAIAQHFYRMWRDLGVEEKHIQPNWLTLGLEFIDQARRTLNYQAFVAEAEGNIVGAVSGQRFAGLYPPILSPTHRQYGYIWGVYVEPAYRNRGVATRLTQLIVDYLQGMGCTKVALNAAPKARSLYEKLGFSESNLMELNFASQEVEMTLSLTPESVSIADYLMPSAVVDADHPAIDALARSLTAEATSPVAQTKIVYEWVRDAIAHTCDIQAIPITNAASEVLAQGHGFCFAKAHLLAALLRHCGIPTGFCYQRLVFDDAQPTRYTLHGLNAVYLSELDRWVRLDARGNKPGVQAEFSGDNHCEQLAFPIRPHLGEVDYPTIYTQPHPLVVTALQTYPTAADLIAHLPTAL